MSYTEKIDILDLIIKILNEHEKKFDELVERLEIVTVTLEQAEPAPVPSTELEEDQGLVNPESSKYLEENR